MARLRVTQKIPRPPEDVFPFFADAKNLERITPPWLGFKVLATSTPDMREGTLIDYKLRIHGVPVRWRTLIKTWRPNEVFVDTQLRGPYRLWHHEHRFESVEGGTLMTDTVDYEVPFGILGRAVAGRLVTRDVKRIFDYRFKEIENIFS